MSKITKFEEFSINRNTLSALRDIDFEQATEVQAEAIPPALEGNDVVVQARTGSGKTHSFLIPVYESIEAGNGVRAIVLTPTRELAQQVELEARKIAKHHGLKTVAIYGGASISRQINKLKDASFVAGTPGRVIDLMKRGELKLKNIDFFVLDEADRMLDMGFLPDIKWIISRTNNDKQVMLYSATMPSEIMRLARKYMDDPHRMLLSEDDVSAKGIDQYFIRVGKTNKLARLSALLDTEPGKYLIFSNTKKWTQILSEKLQRLGYKAHPMHGDMSQSARTNTMNRFKKGDIDILVSTDVSARGIDVENITHVVNYDIPRYEKDYVHRIGRTGRLGKDGKAITFVTGEELEFLERIEEYIDKSLEVKEIDGTGRVKMKTDYNELSDIYGMVPFRFSLKKDASKWDIVRNMKNHGIREEEVGKIEIENDTGEVEVVQSKANRVPKIEYFDNIEVMEKDPRRQ
ncbi:MAG: DEAD/DEAH box helicase [Candidatus Saliniplasma sp.]